MRLFLSAISCFFINTLSATETSPALKALDEIVTIMDEHYYDANYAGLNWTKLIHETELKIKQAASDKEAYQLLTRTLSRLGHSHIKLIHKYSKKNHSLELPKGKVTWEPGFQVERVDKKWLIVHVDPKSPAYKAGLKTGFELIKVGQYTVNDFFNKHLDFWDMKEWLRSYPTQTISLTVGSKNSTKIINYKMNLYTGTVGNIGHVKSETEFEVKMLPDKIAYIRFNIFLIQPVMKVISEIKHQQATESRGIILDLRNNPGGIGSLSTAIAKEFCEENYNLGNQQSREGIHRFPVFAQKEPFKGPLIILMNQCSASTSEVMAIGMQTSGAALIVGENSAGMALPSIFVTLKDGSLFQYPIADFKTVDGKVLEGRGVKPDFPVSHTVEALLKGQDLYIKKAIEVINKTKGK